MAGDALRLRVDVECVGGLSNDSYGGARVWVGHKKNGSERVAAGVAWRHVVEKWEGLSAKVDGMGLDVMEMD